MEQIYLDFTRAIDSLFYPMFLYLTSFVVPEVDPAAFGGVTYVFALLAFFYDATIFPLWFSVSLTVFLFSLFVAWLFAFLRWLADIVPVW